MDGCIFCKIVNKEIPSKIIYEDEYTLSFLDVSPVSNGHTLVIPKKHFENIFDISEEYLSNVIKSVKKVSIILKEKLGCSSVNILNASGKDAQQTVFHLHFHIVPRDKDDGLDLFMHGNNSQNINIESVYEKIKK